MPEMLCLADMSLVNPNKNSAFDRNKRLVIDFFRRNFENFENFLPIINVFVI